MHKFSLKLIPALVLDDGTVIDESIAICRYFETLHPEPNLMGRDAKEAALIECWQRRIEFDGLATIASVYRNTQPLFANRAQPGGGPDTAQIPELADHNIVLEAAPRDTDAASSRPDGRTTMAPPMALSMSTEITLPLYWLLAEKR